MDAPAGTVTLVFAEGDRGPGGGWGIGAAGGFEVKSTAFGCMAAFGEAGAAARYALGLQARAAQAGAAGYRVGIATGEAILEREAAGGRADYFGPTVNRAARIMSAAHPGQILLSDAARRAAGGEIGPRDLGEHRLRDIERPERLHLLLPEAWKGREFPPLRTLRTSPTNLPPQATSFVGRADEMRQLSALLGDPGVRTVTLTGGAGVGKTRLAIRAAADLVETLEGGAWFADLADENGPEGIARAVAEALGIPASASGPVQAVAAALELRGRTLLLLDTFDLLTPHAAATLGAWAARAPLARFLVTSRSPLGLPGERELRLEPLPPHDARRLFVERAQEARSGAAYGPGEEGDVAQICAELDGIPLAIELAAARARILSPAEIVKKLGQKFQLLRSGRKDAAPRQQTLAAAIEWSLDQLAAWERSALGQMTVFRGGFSPEAADAVVNLAAHAGAPGGAAAARALVLRGLLSARNSDFGTRFGMPRTLAEFAASRHAHDGPEGREAAEERHAQWCLRFAEALDGRPAQREARDLARWEVQNFFAVQDRLQDRPGRALDVARLLAAARATLQWRGPFGEALGRYERASAALDSAGRAAEPATAIRLSLGHLRMLKALGRWRDALGIAEQAAAAGRGLKELSLLAEVLWEVAYLSGSLSDYRRSDEALGQSEVLAREAGATLRVIACLHMRSVRTKARGDAVRALELAREALELSRGLPAREDALAESLNVMASLLSDLDKPGEALALYGEAMAIDEKLGNESGLAIRLGNAGDAMVLRGDAAGGLASFRRAAEIDRRLGRGAYVLYGQIRQSWALRLAGDLTGARRLAQESGPGIERLRSPQLRAIWGVRRFETLLAQGENDAVARDFEDVLNQAKIDEDPTLTVAAVALGVRALVRLGRAEEALALLEREFPGDISPTMATLDRFSILAVRAIAAAAAGRREEAVTHARAAMEAASRLESAYGPRNPQLSDLLPELARAGLP